MRVTAGAAKDRYGNPLTIKVHGPVEPYFRDKGLTSRGAASVAVPAKAGTHTLRRRDAEGAGDLRQQLVEQ